MNRKPKLRFKGFIEDWEECKLGEVCTLITKQTGFDYSATIKPALVKEKSDETYSFIQNKDFEGENINLDTDFYIPIKVAEKFPKIILDTPSLLISISGKIGNIGYYKLEKKSFIGGAVAVCKLKKDNGSIIAYSLQSDSGQAYFHSFVKASSHANITVEDIRKIIAKLPCSLDEQCKVSNFLYNIDNLITLQQNKYDKLLNIKKSMLEKMFPKEHSNIPEIRFKGFNDKWEERKLGEVGSVAMCRRIFKWQTKDNGEIPFYKIGTFSGIADAFISRELFEEYRNKYPYPSIGTILISASGSIGRTVVFTGKEEYFQDSNIVWLKHDKNLNDVFLKYTYEIIKWAGVEGSTIKRLYNENILKTNITLPKLEEQQKIGSFFYQLDHLITLHKRKLEKLKNIKKSCLEKMFV